MATCDVIEENLQETPSICQKEAPQGVRMTAHICDVAEQVSRAIQGWSRFAEQAGVSEADCHQLSRCSVVTCFSSLSWHHCLPSCACTICNSSWVKLNLNKVTAERK